MMDSYPPINGVTPQMIFGTRVPRDDDREFPGVTEADTHQMRAVYTFDDVTANIIPEFDEQDDGTWVPHWTVQVYEGSFGGGDGEYGPFESVEKATQHVDESMEKLA